MATSPANISFAERKLNQAPQTNTEVITNIPLIETANQSTTQSRFKFSDISISSDDPQVDYVTDHDAVVQSVLTILGTNKRTRWRRPNFGADIERHLFDPLDNITAQTIQSKIYQALTDPQNGDNRLLVRQVRVEPDSANLQFFCTIRIDVPSLGLTNQNVNFGLRAA